MANENREKAEIGSIEEATPTFTTRREAREAREKAARTAKTPQISVPTPSAPPAGDVAKRSGAVVARPARAKKTGRSFRVTRRGVVSGVVLTAAAGLVASMVLPSAGLGSVDSASAATDSVQQMSINNGQHLTVSDVQANEVISSSYGASTQAAAPAAQNTQQTQNTRNTQSTATTSQSKSSSKAAAQSAASVSVPLSGSKQDQVVQIAEQYLGIPYVFGGASPSQGFDCSGLVMYVLAQLGLSVPHDSSTIGNYGTTIPQSQAVPGDLVVWNDGSHIAIYLGGNNIIEAPRKPLSVRIHSIWSSAVHYVRMPL